ncbi:EamA family transporter RarD [Sphingorhabdus sp. YGSMI21]|uniref:EamA family transporter RarD n=1 Tax=Sphingorhabdus sp. YGSMI21 TaxID=2077182 RepID=UPI000C1F5EB9|nr:EamA family transporter RarD [Sphingorhabdus sp. YGSMI21]ATW03176.1 protein RarD [Sphingorhabdus sp. YGSMI21]
MSSALSSSRIGLVQALTACIFWGLMPVYFKLLQNVGALEVVAHRIVWSVPLLLVILYFRKNLVGLASALADRRLRLAMLASASLIAANWLIYVWAVHEDHILAASLGYFISPLLSVLMGRLFLGERLSPKKWIAIAIATAGVSVLALQALDTLWISLALAISWSSYGLVRKIADIGPIVGLTAETGMLFLPFTLLLVWLTMSTPSSASGLHLGDDRTIDLLLIGGSIVTAIPLLLFASAVKKMTLGAIGLLNYLAPTIQFLVGVLIYREPLTPSHIICFMLIWTSLAIFSTDSYLTGKAERKPQSA